MRENVFLIKWLHPEHGWGDIIFYMSKLRAKRTFEATHKDVKSYDLYQLIERPEKP